MKHPGACILTASILGGCAAVDVPLRGPPVTLINGNGQSIGTAVPAQTSGGVTLAISASGLPHGLHGIHIHGVGRCDPPAFDSAGPHWNPASTEHGFNNPKGPHAGDLANVTISSNGVLNETVVIARADFTGLADMDGSALVIHADADDYVTDPSGNSGARIACGVLAPPR